MGCFQCSVSYVVYISVVFYGLSVVIGCHCVFTFLLGGEGSSLCSLSWCRSAFFSFFILEKREKTQP